MKPATQIHIRSMRVRVPGTSKEAGCALAESLREQLDNLPEGSDATHIGAMRLRIPGSPRFEARSVSHAITTAISSKLTRNQTHA